MGRHRHVGVRPRYGRVAAAATSCAVTAVAVLGGAGLLPSAAQDARGAAIAPAAGSVSQPVTDPSSAEVVEPLRRSTPPTRSEMHDRSRRVPQVPTDSGEGRRVVFSEGAQRVWLVRAGGGVARTYPVSGSVYDNLDPGTYSVYSRSEQAWGIDDSGTMKYFVRFTQGDNGAAIGFHDIPVDDGERVQTVDQLGTPLSHGCIRQRRVDAVALWEFAPLGTTVVVTA